MEIQGVEVKIVECWNLRCKHRGLEGCLLDRITIGGTGLCKECDYEL